MNPAWPSALLCLALTGAGAADEADELRKLGAGVFTTACSATTCGCRAARLSTCTSMCLAFSTNRSR